jgi:hypothetical protein
VVAAVRVEESGLQAVVNGLVESMLGIFRKKESML